MLELIWSLLGQVTGLFTNLTATNSVILILIFIVFIILMLKVLQFLLRAVVTGVAFGFFPVVASYLGMGVPLTFESVIGSAIFGIFVYLAYSAARTAFKVIRMVLSPFTRLFKKKEKKHRHEPRKESKNG
jgi:hypothetical protein